jgi:hypothetical protein
MHNKITTKYLNEIMWYTEKSIHELKKYPYV